MIAALPRACAAGLSGPTSTPVATCAAREDALDVLPVRTMTADDENPAIETVVLAFAADPVTRWAWPHPHQYMAAMPRFVRAFGGGAFGMVRPIARTNTLERRYGCRPECIPMKIGWVSSWRARPRRLLAR